MLPYLTCLDVCFPACTGCTARGKDAVAAAGVAGVQPTQRTLRVLCCLASGLHCAATDLCPCLLPCLACRCVPPQQVLPGIWNLTAFATASSPAHAARVLAILTPATAALLAGASGWPCVAMDLAANCPLAFVTQTVCNVPPLPPSPPPPAPPQLAPPQPPPRPPFPPSITCTLTYAASTCNNTASSFPQATINQRCAQVAVIIGQLYISGVQLNPSFSCSYSSLYGFVVYATTVTRYDAQLFWNNFYTSSAGMIPMVSVTGESRLLWWGEKLEQAPSQARGTGTPEFFIR